ncbi:MAG: peptidoglycan-binding protein, partial [Verrucomicrobiota bacterium]|nr:peptidoglycan-binding protein [Verrucomicrobiota bacterium]
DETTRQVQEELRRRHLYYNDIDGRTRVDVAAALRKYQERQGLATTGIPDDDTLRSLGIINEPAAPADGAGDALPDIPVLRSDSAPQNHEAKSAPPTVTVSRGHTEPPTRREVSEFVQKYFAACATPNVHDELSFFDDRVDYFDHGTVDKAYIQNELATYDQRWTRRSYNVSKSIAIANEKDKVTAKFRVAFQVANGPSERQASGETLDTLGVARGADNSLRIVSIKESRVKPASRSRHARRAARARRAPAAADPVVRNVQKAFHSIFAGGRASARKARQ